MLMAALISSCALCSGADTFSVQVWLDPISPASRYYPIRSVLYPPRRRPSNLGAAPSLSSPTLSDTADGHDPLSIAPLATVPTEKGKGEETIASVEAAAYVLTTRFEHAATEDGDYIITGRDGDLQKCEDEPIRSPGAIQAFGVLIAFDVQTNGHLKVQQVSEVRLSPS